MLGPSGPMWAEETLSVAACRPLGSVQPTEALGDAVLMSTWTFAARGGLGGGGAEAQDPCGWSRLCQEWQVGLQDLRGPRRFWWGRGPGPGP